MTRTLVTLAATVVLVTTTIGTDDNIVWSTIVGAIAGLWRLLA